jgi:nicotinate-nucleotide adenylyltransferase
MNIIYGGSFNPPTIAHLHIITTLLDTFEHSKVIVLPVGNDYNKPDLIDFNYRFEMLSLLLKSHQDSVVISDLENHKGYNGTLKALEDLSKSYKHLHFVIGSDHLESLKTWISYKDLLEKYPFIVMNRNHFMTKEQAEMMFKDIKHKFIFIDFDMDVSSTKIRKNIDENKNYLTKEVYQYIKNHKLYEVS